MAQYLPAAAPVPAAAVVLTASAIANVAEPMRSGAVGAFAQTLNGAVVDTSNSVTSTRTQQVTLVSRPAALGCTLLVALLAGCGTPGQSHVNQGLLRQVERDLATQQPLMTALGEGLSLAMTPTVTESCIKSDGMVLSQPMLERQWRGTASSAQSVADTVKRRLEGNGWTSDSAGSEIIRMVSPVATGPRFEAEVSVENDGDADQGTITISERGAAPCG